MDDAALEEVRVDVRGGDELGTERVNAGVVAAGWLLSGAHIFQLASASTRLRQPPSALAIHS